MNEELFKQALEKAFSKIQKQILTEIGSNDFDWDFFISLFLKEGTPLVHVFSAKTMQYAELYCTAKKMATIADDIDNEDK